MRTGALIALLLAAKILFAGEAPSPTVTPAVDIARQEARQESDDRDSAALRDLACRARVLQAKLLELRTKKEVAEAHQPCPVNP